MASTATKKPRFFVRLLPTENVRQIARNAKEGGFQVLDKYSGNEGVRVLEEGTLVFAALEGPFGGWICRCNDAYFDENSN